MFDDTAAKLIRKSAVQLLEVSEDDGDESVLPAAILALYNTKHTLELKSQTYYDQGAYESFTVSNLINAAAEKEDSSVPIDADGRATPLKRGRNDKDEDNNHCETTAGASDEHDSEGTASTAHPNVRVKMKALCFFHPCIFIGLP